MKGKAGQKLDVDGTACYISCGYGSIANNSHTAIQKEDHELLLQMDEPFVPKRVNQHICICLTKNDDIEFCSGLIGNYNFCGGPVALYLLKSLFLACQFDDILGDLNNSPPPERRAVEIRRCQIKSGACLIYTCD